MATVIDRIERVEVRWRHRHSALRLADETARKCLANAGRDARDIDLLVNAGVYRDRNLGEPALAAMIQDDIGANPEDPHAGSHGTFSFDVMNGSCGVLTALQVVDGFLRSRVIDCALIVASDADPGHGMSERFPYAPACAALLCTWTDDDRGIGRTYWANHWDRRDSLTAAVGMVDHRNILRVKASATADLDFAEAAADAARHCLDEHGLTVDDLDAIAAAPATHGFRAALADRLGVAPERLTCADDQRVHTAGLAFALDGAMEEAGSGGRILAVAAAAGVTAGAALYRG